MGKTIQQKNKELLIEGFNTLFNKRDFAALRNSGRLTIFNTADIFHPGERVCLGW